MRIKCSGIFASSIAYACIRYVLFGNVALTHFPAYLLNKAFAVSSVICLLFALIGFSHSNKVKQHFWSSCASGFALVHIIISIALLSPSYYPGFYNQEMLSLYGELAILGGVLAMFCFLRFVRCFKHTWLMLLLIATLMLHVTSMGFEKWITPGKWNGGLPPISLIAFVVVLSCVYFIKKNR